MHDSMQYDPIQGQVQYHEPFKVLCHLQWELATDHGFLNLGTIPQFARAGFLIFGLVFVLHDFKVVTNISCEESTISPVQS